MLCEHGNIAPCVECDIEPLKAENETLRTMMAGLVEALESAKIRDRLADGEIDLRESVELLNQLDARADPFKAIHEKASRALSAKHKRCIEMGYDGIDHALDTLAAVKLGPRAIR